MCKYWTIFYECSTELCKEAWDKEECKKCKIKASIALSETISKQRIGTSLLCVMDARGALLS